MILRKYSIITLFYLILVDILIPVMIIVVSIIGHVGYVTYVQYWTCAAYPTRPIATGHGVEAESDIK